MRAQDHPEYPHEQANLQRTLAALTARIDFALYDREQAETHYICRGYTSCGPTCTARANRPGTTRGSPSRSAGTAKTRWKSPRRHLGDEATDPLIDQLHRAMRLWKAEEDEGTAEIAAYRAGR